MEGGGLPQIPNRRSGPDVQVGSHPRAICPRLSRSIPSRFKLYEALSDSEGQSLLPAPSSGRRPTGREQGKAASGARRGRLIEKWLGRPGTWRTSGFKCPSRFGTNIVAEVMGRSRRIIVSTNRLVGRKPRRLRINLAEGPRLHGDVQAHHGVLGRRRHRTSYHANCQPREEAACESPFTLLRNPDGKADGPHSGHRPATNRTNQGGNRRCFGPSQTDGESRKKRFLSTIATAGSDS